MNMRKIIFACFVVVFLPLAVRAQTNNSQQQKMDVMMKMLSLKNALIAKDSVVLSNLLVADVTYGHSNGLIQTKPELIRAVMSGEQDYKSIEPSDMKVRIYDNTAVVTMKSKVNMIFKGKQTDLNLYVELVWIKSNSEWKLVTRQSVKSGE